MFVIWILHAGKMHLIERRGYCMKHFGVFVSPVITSVHKQGIVFCSLIFCQKASIVIYPICSFCNMMASICVIINLHTKHKQP